MKPLVALAAAAACALPLQAWGQSGPQAAPAACPKAAQVGQVHLLGLWRAEFEGLPTATLLLERHPEYAQSLAGSINRNGERARLAGDIEDGEFTLEESADGRSISATWIGDAVEGACGREIRGTWQRTGDPLARPFVLRSLAPR